MNTWTLLVNLTVKSSLVLAVATLLTLALRRHSAAARHMVWTAAFAALLALPLLSVMLPAWPHPLANALLSTDSGITFHAAATAAGPGATAAARATAPVTADAKTAPGTAGFPRIAVWLWAAGAAVALFHMLLAYASLWKLRRTARAAGCDPAEFGIDEPVPLLECDHAMPMAGGVLRPAIFLPAEAADWSWERLRLVVLHESAHIRRGDAAAQLLARAALCLHWFNPLAWFAWRGLLRERERAADDLVLMSGALASDYAGHLLAIARTATAAPAVMAAGIAMARRSNLEGRLRAILDGHVKRADAGRTALAAALVAALVATAPLATVRAQSQAEQRLPADIGATIAAANAQKNHELLEQTAAAFEKARQYDQAQTLREAALAIRKQESDARYAEGLVRLGDLMNQRRSQGEALKLYTQAVQLGDMPETVPALIHLALAERVTNLPLAKEYLERARNAAKSGNDLGLAMTWLAMIQEGDPAVAPQVESMYHAALALEDPGSSAQALTTEFLARHLRGTDLAAEAEPLEQRAAAMRKTLAAGLSEPSLGPASGAYRVGGGVAAPKLLFKLEPAYSEEARAAKVSGTVLLKVVIDTDGQARDAQVAKGVGFGLDEQAVMAVAAWKFKPGESGGVPVPVQAQIEVNFRLM